VLPTFVERHVFVFDKNLFRNMYQSVVSGQMNLRIIAESWKNAVVLLKPEWLFWQLSPINEVFNVN